MNGLPGDARQDIGEPGLRVDAVHLGCDDQAVEDGGTLPTAVGAAEQPRLAAEGHAAQRPLGGVVADTDPPVIEESRCAFRRLQPSIPIETSQ